MVFVGCWECVSAGRVNSELPLWLCSQSCCEWSNTPAAQSRCATAKTARSLEENKDWRDGYRGPAGSQASQTATGQLEIPLD